jgi:excisionase family DNA binding protein
MSCDPGDEGLWSVEEVRQFLKIRSSDAVYHMLQREGLPCVRLGRRVRFVPSAVKSWVVALQDKR